MNIGTLLFAGIALLLGIYLLFGKQIFASSKRMQQPVQFPFSNKNDPDINWMRIGFGVGCWFVAGVLTLFTIIF